MNRRNFIKLVGLQTGLIYSGLSLGFKAFAAQPLATGRDSILVFVNLRGAMDGLSMVAPLEDPHYNELRPSIRLQATGEKPALKLESGFWFHPRFESLMPFWKDRTLAIIHQVGPVDPTRSHFDAQDNLETGTPGIKTTQDGFLNRAMATLNPPAKGTLRAVALQALMPRSLQGGFPAVSMASTRDFDLKDGKLFPAALGFEEMYAQATDTVFRGAGKDAFDHLSTLKKLKDSVKKDGHKSETEYPKSQLGKRLEDIATLIKGDLGLQVAVTEMGGWDTHIRQGATDGQLADRFRELSDALSAFARDLGPKFNDVCIVVQTEFGRTVQENGNGGTDHGHGSAMMVLGGQVQGGKVYGTWKDLNKQNLFEMRDLPVTTDARQVWSEILTQHMGIQNLSQIFPKFESSRQQRLGILRV